MIPGHKSIEINSNMLESGKKVYRIRCDKKECWLVDQKYSYYNYPKNYFKTIVIKEQLTFFYSEISNEIYKLTPQKKGMSKVTLASFKDYYYEVNDDIMKRYFSQWFNEHEAKSMGIPQLQKKPPLGRRAPAEDVQAERA